MAVAHGRALALVAGLCVCLLHVGDASARTIRAPAEVPAFVLLAQTPQELANAAGDSACRFAHAQPNHTKRLLILPFGRADRSAGRYGTELHGTTFTNGQIFDALTNAASIYESCRDDRGGAGKRVVMAYAAGNNDISAEGPGVPEKIGVHQFRVARLLERAGFPHVSAAVAGDIEPGYDPGPKGTYPVAATQSLVRGAASHSLDYYDYGTAGVCPPVSRCQGQWSLADLGQLAHGLGSGGAPGQARPIPEVYSPAQALQWALVRARWQAKQHSPFVFAGAMAEPTTCSVTTLEPFQSWLALRRRNLGTSLARELIFFNPDAVDCQ